MKNGKISKEAARLFEESVHKGPVINKDAGGGGRKKAPPKEEDPHVLTVDLHGHNLEEASESARKAIARAKRNGYTEVRLITGTGKHSPGLYSPLYAGMEDLLSGLKLDFKKSDGVFKIWLK